MPKPRKALISLDATPYYHCISRCVRRAFLCGFDKVSGKSYEHRKAWVEERILFLGSVFCIDVCAYAVMSNHHHLVLHINSEEANTLSDIEVCVRWHKLYKGTLLTQKFAKGESLNKAEEDAVKIKISEWRAKLFDISWFMRALNEPIARMANAEDNCTGRFWESRFKSQALLDEKALAACMAYVDLNPIRANIADTPEASEHTSAHTRIKSLKEEKTQPLRLAHFVGNLRQNMPPGLPFNLYDYLELLDMTGRIVRDDKRGSINLSSSPILERLAIKPSDWIVITTKFESRFSNLIGCTSRIRQALLSFGYSRHPKRAQYQAAFG